MGTYKEVAIEMTTLSTNTISTASPLDIQRIVEICRHYGVAMVGLFGSQARGTANAQSDIDLLVRFAAPTSLLKAIALEQELETALGRHVDLLTEAALNPYLRANIISDLRVLYEAI
ncbi:DNA polymerase beta subunit [Oscillochloris trichoides DG-6]|uniref:DNA polymerase beta subunit n=1 Tax=Oscillochloris trichoides DG-6 TaxID=765420 RepID=E1IDP0_9CHLR|nr:DNA polymerase beta subunit [Oscillochloris trichoides DG-6]